MAERIADNAELIVDEMRRKARRRLVGAIVLALAVAIVVPMLLEKDPRPLGDDVSVQIPPIDQGKFVNRLTGKAGESKVPPKSDGKPNPAAAAKAETAAEAPAFSTPVAPPKADAAVAQKADPAAPPKAEPAAKTEAAGAATQEAKGDTKPSPKAGAKPVTPGEASAESKAAAATAAPAGAAASQSAAAASATAKAEGFVVQLAAFADDKGANALANKLKKGGYAAYVEPVNTSRGTLWRVRVGGYGTRPEADAARVALKGEGYSGIIAPSQ
jgi:DedD protein